MAARLESVRDISLNIRDRQAAGNRDARGFATTAGAGITSRRAGLADPAAIKCELRAFC